MYLIIADNRKIKKDTYLKQIKEIISNFYNLKCVNKQL